MDLPTLGRPTTATTGMDICGSPALGGGQSDRAETSPAASHDTRRTSAPACAATSVDGRVVEDQPVVVDRHVGNQEYVGRSPCGQRRRERYRRPRADRPRPRCLRGGRSRTGSTARPAARARERGREAREHGAEELARHEGHARTVGGKLGRSWRERTGTLRCLVDERADHADAVLVLREVVVLLGSAEAPPRPRGTARRPRRPTRCSRSERIRLCHGSSCSSTAAASSAESYPCVMFLW